jgi:Zn-dependent protease with chaperone function
MRSLAEYIDDALDAVAGRGFDANLVRDNVIDLGGQADRVKPIAAALNAIRGRRGFKAKQALVLWTPGYSAVTKRGPYIYIARAIVEKLSDDAIAFILAHEMGHHDLRHLSPTVVIAGFLGNRQRMEFQADRYGLDLAVEAGFDAKGAFEALDPEFWGVQTEQDATGSDLPPALAELVDRFRRSHPPLPDRLAALRQVAGIAD